MSYDSIRMLEEARSYVRGGIYPAGPVYILRFFDAFGNGLTLMLQAQNFILLLSLMLILRLLGAGLTCSTIALVVLVAIPTVIGCMLVLWKDVTLTSLMICSIAVVYWAHQTRPKANCFRAAKWGALSLLILGTLVRFNAITSTAVILVYWVIVFYHEDSIKKKFWIFATALLLNVIFSMIINNYRFPEFKRLPPNPLTSIIMINDLIGISKWSGVSLIPFDSRESDNSFKEPIEKIERIYSPLGAVEMNNKNVRLGNIVRTHPPKYTQGDIIRAWGMAIYQHPLAYLKYRWDLFAEIIGATTHKTFEPTHFNRIDENPFGIKFEERAITSYALEYIKIGSGLPIGKPWIMFIVSAICFLYYALKKSSLSNEINLLSIFSFAAALLYIAPFFIISGTGEVRYSFPSIILCSVPIFIVICSSRRTAAQA